MSASLDSLPDRAILAIANHLQSGFDLLRFSNVNSRFRRLINDSTDIWTELVKKGPYSDDPQVLRLANQLKPEFPDACNAKLTYIVVKKTLQNMIASKPTARRVCDIFTDPVPLHCPEQAARLYAPDLVGCVWTSGTDIRSLRLMVWSSSDQFGLKASVSLEGPLADGKPVKVLFVEVFGRIIVVGLGQSR